MKIYILLGGFFGPDGWVTSAGFLGLASQLKPFGTVKTYTWDRYLDALGDIRKLPFNEKVVVAGYSGGGSRATWLANDGKAVPIDLMVLYDPSPPWQMKNLAGTAVKKCIQYHNTSPFFFGLGGGRTVGPQVTTVDIAENHMLVQGDQGLHKQTIDAIKAL